MDIIEPFFVGIFTLGKAAENESFAVSAFFHAIIKLGIDTNGLNAATVDS